MMMDWVKWLFKKSGPAAGSGSGMGTAMSEALSANPAPTPGRLVRDVRATAWSCASINASVCASWAPKLYRKGSKTPIEDHPLVTLLDTVNPWMNKFDLFELTQLYLEVTGTAYWLLDMGVFGTPDMIWLLPSQFVTPVYSSSRMIEAWRYIGGAETKELDVNEVIQFRCPDLIDPYLCGYSPAKAAWEQIAMSNEYSAFKVNKFRNHAIPDAIVTPDEVVGNEEAQRLEAKWNQKMRGKGAGRVIVAESKMHVNLLQHSLGDAAALADIKSTREEIAFAFGIPQPFVSGATNLANLQASEKQHARLTIRPRLRRRDEKLNEQLVPWFDPSGQLYLASEDPDQEDREFQLRRRNTSVQLGIMSIDEARAEMGLPERDGT